MVRLIRNFLQRLFGGAKSVAIHTKVYTILFSWLIQKGFHVTSQEIDLLADLILEETRKER